MQEESLSHLGKVGVGHMLKHSNFFNNFDVSLYLTRDLCDIRKLFARSVYPFLPRGRHHYLLRSQGTET